MALLIFPTADIVLLGGRDERVEEREPRNGKRNFHPQTLKLELYPSGMRLSGQARWITSVNRKQEHTM